MRCTKPVVGTVLFLLLLQGCVHEENTSSTRPDIVLVLVDDLGLEVLTAYGGTSYATPHIDQLARESVLLKHVYSMPLCTPSRVQLLTGKYNDETYRGFGILDSGLTTLPMYLHAAGYRSNIVGKWQLYGNDQQRKLAGQGGSTPEEAGFDYHCVWQMDTLGSRYYDPTITENGVTKTHYGAYGPDYFAGKVDSLLSAPAASPQFLFYSMVLTHAPFVPAPDAATENGEQRNDPANFGSMVTALDREMGHLLETVHQRKRPTLLIFVGDNGTDSQIVSICNGDAIRGGKGLTNDRGTHVPGFVWYPDSLSGNSVYEGMIDFTDFIPTLLDLVHSSAHDYHGPGKSFWNNMVRGGTPAREIIYSAYDPKWGNWASATYTQDATWKLYSDGRFYHLPTDPEEQSPLADSLLDFPTLKQKARLQERIDNQGYFQENH